MMIVSVEQSSCWSQLWMLCGLKEIEYVYVTNTIWDLSILIDRILKSENTCV